LFLLRHGEVDTRYHRVFGGRIDMDLSPRGREQAELLARYLKRVRLDAIYVSPKKRAQQTLAPLAALQAPAPVTLPDLREVDFGDWTGLTWEQVQEKFGVSAFDWLHRLDQAAIPGAESAQQFRARVEPCLRQILSECPGRTVGVVCHGGVIRMLLAILLDLPVPQTANFHIEYASLSIVTCRPHRTEVDLMNFTPWEHLP
jgi:broad specificity phosphatase PhoE